MERMAQEKRCRFAKKNARVGSAWKEVSVIGFTFETLYIGKEKDL